MYAHDSKFGFSYERNKGIKTGLRNTGSEQTKQHSV